MCYTTGRLIFNELKNPPIFWGIFYFSYGNFPEMNLTSDSPGRHIQFYNQSPSKPGQKPQLMNKRSIINKSIILLVFIVAGFLLARSLYYGSLIGIIFALIGIAAWTMFLYKLSTIQSEENNPEEIQENY